MSEKMLDSGMTRSSSHLASIYGKDFLELVSENDKILVQGGSSNRTRRTPLCIAYSVNPSPNDEDASITEKTKLSTSYTLLDHFPTQKDSYVRSSPQSNSQDFRQNVFQSSQSKNQFKPNEDFTHLRPVKDSKLTGGAHQPFTTVLKYSSQQQCLPSSPLKKPRTDSSQTPTTNSQKQHMGCDQRSGKVNFSNFLIPAVFLKSTHQGKSATQKTRNASSARVEIEPKAVATVASISNKTPDNSSVIEAAKGSHGCPTGFKEQTSLTANKSNPTSVAERSVELAIDEHSEAIGRNETHGSHGQNHNQTSLRAKGKANSTRLSNERASSSVCSIGASNNRNFGFGKHEDAEDSTYLSDNDEEQENTVAKEMAAREDNRLKRSRNPEIHNLSERKRRDRINKKMRTLKELIPNCNKMDKASMLDDAINYLKTLKLQVQIMSINSGLCMPFMMLPAAAHLPQLMGAGMGFGPRTGIAYSPPQFPINIPPFSGVTNNRLQMFGFSNQIPPIPNAPFGPPILGNSSTQPLMGTTMPTKLANSATNLEVLVPNNLDLYSKAENATKQAENPSPQH